MRKLILALGVACFLLGGLAAGLQGVLAQAGDAWSLIAEVNALRASYGQTSYEIDNSLMAAAQAHSEYQAQIGSATHSGPGGTRPHDRAVAAGYGSGAQVNISENVATGTNLSVQQTVYEIWQDAVHLNTMISPSYRHIGAGVAFSSGEVYYTIDVGYIAGATGSIPAQENPTPSAPALTAAPTEPAAVPIQVATPMPDGSIWHVVQWGQFLENIASAYGLSVQDLMARNGLDENTTIYEGDKLLIKLGTDPAMTESLGGTGQVPATTTTLLGISPEPPEVTQSPEITTEPSPSPTSTPARPTATPIALARAAGVTPTVQADPSGIQAPFVEPRRGPDYLLIAIGVLGVAGVGLIALGTALKRIP